MAFIGYTGNELFHFEEYKRRRITSWLAEPQLGANSRLLVVARLRAAHFGAAVFILAALRAKTGASL
jgi:hypothetical protein